MVDFFSSPFALVIPVCCILVLSFVLLFFCIVLFFHTPYFCLLFSLLSLFVSLPFVVLSMFVPSFGFSKVLILVFLYGPLLFSLSTTPNFYSSLLLSSCHQALSFFPSGCPSFALRMSVFCPPKTIFSYFPFIFPIDFFYAAPR